MKKILSSLLIFLSLVSTTHGACSLESGGISSGMADYLSKLNIVLASLSGLATANTCSASFSLPKSGITDDADRTIRSIIAATNSVWSFDSFNDSFRYWGDLLSQLDIPKVTEQWRQALESARTKILTTLRNITSRCAKNITIPSGTTGIWAVDWQTLYGALWKILQNHIRIQQLFYKASLDDPLGPRQEDFIIGLVWEDFEKDIRQKYSSTATAECKSQSGTAESIGERLKKIFAKGISIDTKQTSWAESWAILNGSYDAAKMRALERRLLLAEMQRQGMSSAGTQIILGNLNRYNTTGNRFSENVWPTSFVTGLWNIQKITESLYKPFEIAVQESSNTDTLVRNLTALEYRRDDLSWEMNAMYTENLALITSNDILSIDQKTITDLIALHVKLSNVNTALVTDWIPKAESLCRSQLTGYGVCSFR